MDANSIKLGDVPHDVLRMLLGTRCMDSAGLAEGTNANTLKTARAISYMIDGQLYYKGATDNIAMTACAAQADGTTCLYLVTINASGTVKVTKGTDDVTTALPACPEDECPIGAFKIVTDGATFTSGTDDLGGASFTDTYADIGVRGLSDVPTFA
jgi:hypothetical protein